MPPADRFARRRRVHLAYLAVRRYGTAAIHLPRDGKARPGRASRAGDLCARRQLAVQVSVGVGLLPEKPAWKPNEVLAPGATDPL